MALWFPRAAIGRPYPRVGPPLPPSIPRSVPSQRLQREALADRAKRVAFDDAGRRHRLGDRFADVGKLHRTAGQKHRVDVGCGQSRLPEADLDAGRDALGQLPGMADKIGACDRGVEPRCDPFMVKQNVAPNFTYANLINYSPNEMEREAVASFDEEIL